MKSRFYLYRKTVAGLLAIPVLLCLFYSYAMAASNSEQAMPCAQGHEKKETSAMLVQHCNPVLASVYQRDLKPIQIPFQTEAYIISFVNAPPHAILQQASQHDTQQSHPSLQNSYLQNHVFRL